MKNIFLLAIIALLIGCKTKTEVSKVNQFTYDSALAKSLGADDYGMKNYVMAFLKSGTVKITDSTERTILQKAHLKNIQRLADEGKLIIAGPFLDNQEIRGIFIFNVETLEEAKTLTETDPAIKAGTLVMELHPWYGSAALVESVKIHRKIQRNNFGE
ncbi:MAG: hypothetical protein HOO91_06580 [Bacteroidales bacterium]|nr:hypothetical protein [Bacteroidales bacterium]